MGDMMLFEVFVISVFIFLGGLLRIIGPRIQHTCVKELGYWIIAACLFFGAMRAIWWLCSSIWGIGI